MLEARNLFKRFSGRQVVKNVTLWVASGEIVGLLGPNGAGKSTTFNMMVGSVAPTQGEVLLNGQTITQMPMYLRARQGISYLPQAASVFRTLTVEENLMAVLETLDVVPDVRHHRMQSLLSEFHLASLAKAKANTLSGGERRRLEIARALVLSPKFILLDEPFAGVDPIVILDIKKILFELKQRGIGILMTDHNVQETLSITDRAYIIYQGEILKSGSPNEIAQDEVVREVYLGGRAPLKQASSIHGLA